MIINVSVDGIAAGFIAYYAVYAYQRSERETMYFIIDDYGTLDFISSWD